MDVSVRTVSRTLIGHSMADAHGNILALDRSVCDLLQRSEQQILGMSYAEMTHPDDLYANTARVDTLENRDDPITIRKRYIRPSGYGVWCDVQVSRLAESCNRGRLIGTIYQTNPQDVIQSPEQLWQSARRMNAVLQNRRVQFGEDLFVDLPWALLLQLYLSEAEGRCVNLVELGSRSGSRPESVSRWLRVLADRKLVECLDQSGAAAQLTATGIAKIEKLLDGTQAD